MSDPTLLAIVIDDPLAPRVLACWKALGLPRDKTDADVSKLALLVSGSIEEIKRTITRCELAGLLVDGGISDVADKWLSAHVGQRLAKRPKAKKA